MSNWIENDKDLGKYSFRDYDKLKPDQVLCLHHANLAREGNPESTRWLWENRKMKVYTPEEIRVVKHLRGVPTMEVEEKALDVRSRQLVVDLPARYPTFGDEITLPAQINWLKDLGEGYFLAGLTFTCGYPYGGLSTEWVLKIDPEQGFRPVFSTFEVGAKPGNGTNPENGTN